MIKKGDKLKTMSGLELIIEDGPYSGGQGSVYRVRNGDEMFALKCYHEKYLGNEEKRKKVWDDLSKIVGKKPSDAFAWPMELVEIGDLFGYIMEWVDFRHFIQINKMVSGNAKYNPSLQIKARISLNICTAFSYLHAKGFCYRDINSGNIMFNPKNGDVKIVDNDNVGVDGYSTSNIRGVPDYMAPEILCNFKDISPSKHTDYHSLAVYLFQLWCWHHPFEGKKAIECRCFDRAAKFKFFGKEPVFIFSATDKTNFLPEIADKGTADEANYKYVHKFWKACTPGLQSLFCTAFGEGIKNIESRILETTWRKEFQRIYDTINVCQNCGAENCYTPNVPCWSCGKMYKPPLLLSVKNENNNTVSAAITAMPQKQLLKLHFTRKENDEEVIGVFVVHPKNPKIIGLRNESGIEWTFINEKGEKVVVANGRAVPVVKSNLIDFGNSYKGEFVGD